MQSALRTTKAIVRLTGLSREKTGRWSYVNFHDSDMPSSVREVELESRSGTISGVFNSGNAQPIEDVRLQLSPEGMANPIEIRFEGWWSNKGEGVAIDGSSESRFASVIAKVVSANRSGKMSRILEVWAPESHGRIKRALKDEQALKRNQAFYRNITESGLNAVVRYGDYWLCLVEHTIRGSGGRIKTYPFIERSGDLLSTNELSSDYVFTRLLGKLAERTWEVE